MSKELTALESNFAELRVLFSRASRGGAFASELEDALTGLRGVIAQTVTPVTQADPLSGEQLSRRHSFVRKTLAHHGVCNVHTALVADLIHGLE